MKKYQIIYADPPWDFKGQLQHTGKGGPESGGARRHYNCLKLKDLKKLDIGSLCDDNCLLFLWSTNPHLDQAIDLLKAWGFQWATVGYVWDKQKVNPGFYTMSQCELCLIGKRGKIPQPRGARNMRQLVSKIRGRHSAKPEEVRKRIEEMFPLQRKLEMFARETAPGWDTHGDEVESTVALPAETKND